MFLDEAENRSSWLSVDCGNAARISCGELLFVNGTETGTSEPSDDRCDEDRNSSMLVGDVLLFGQVKR